MYLRHQAYTFLLVQCTCPCVFMYLRVPCLLLCNVWIRAHCVWEWRRYTQYNHNPSCCWASTVITSQYCLCVSYARLSIGKFVCTYAWPRDARDLLPLSVWKWRYVRYWQHWACRWILSSFGYVFQGMHYVIFHILSFCLYFFTLFVCCFQLFFNWQRRITLSPPLCRIPR